jgi:transcriptional regulator with XRE-family HTH domain
MFRDSFLDQLTGNDTRPNKFTIGMGKLIRLAREEAGYNQRDLAELIYRRQAALSDMENGKMEPDATTLLLLAHHLKKPITYFYPPQWKPLITKEQLSESEEELFILIRKLNENDLKKVIAQIKAVVNLEENDQV